MVDIALQVLITRTSLGLSPLDINDHFNYKVAPGLMGGQVTWSKNEVGSPFMDGAVTVNRTRGKVMEPLLVEVFGEDQADLAVNIGALIKAITQDSFNLNIAMGAQAYQYQCEAADYQMEWTGPRFIAKQLQVAMQVPRHPVPIAGPV